MTTHGGNSQECLDEIEDHILTIESYDIMHDGERFDLHKKDYTLVISGLVFCVVLNLVFWFCSWIKHRQFMINMNRKRPSAYELADSQGEVSLDESARMRHIEL
jgi:hypothetical protein